MHIAIPITVNTFITIIIIIIPTDIPIVVAITIHIFPV